MASRSLNKVTLIGNLTRDPELRYTPAGTAVCTFGLATNRYWTTQTGEAKEETEFHRIVAWNKLGELCAQLLVKGRKVYVEGRLSSHSWTGQDGMQRTTTEIVIEDMIILDSKRPIKEGETADNVVSTTAGTAEDTGFPSTDEVAAPSVPTKTNDTQGDKKKVKKIEESKKKNPKTDSEEDKKQNAEVKKEDVNEDITPEDIPF
ncbi:hypothetical protein A2Y99_02760 [Candidatus Gottesmanbacteria bacterium RBG_13_37_7]|uniref:Single-stranded DNA-binding protein n=1 Tax=Candidatus Gottesmanbacteria bacterium RBG_13_37_7 TaxID=1798369 RepID=A0A1F5YKJ2_9BACT|nr:MAG: hypothetical protein A2Y99_02760 [Candidatus Gottesmanbacteria bacterium RBG_13_37_7]